MPILTVERIAVVAFVVILFNGGIDIGMRRLRTSLVPVLSLGLVGTFLTAGAIAAVAHLLLARPNARPRAPAGLAELVACSSPSA